MANLDALESEVAAIKKDTSPLSKFVNAGRNLEAAGQTVSDADIGRLRNIVDDFRGKLPDTPSFRRIRADATDLADSLMLATLAQRIAGIGARNAALSNLTTELNTQVAKGNADANRLKQIKEAVDKGTKTVTEAKAIVDALTATDLTTKQKLKKLIESLGNVSSIFNPQA